MGCWPMWIKRRRRFANLRAIRRIRAAGGATAPKGRRRLTKCMTLSAFYIPSSALARVARGSGSAPPGMRCSTRLRRGFEKPCRKTAARRSCTTLADRGTMAIWTACCKPGAWTATIAIPMSAHPGRAWATPHGSGRTGHLPITPMHALS